MSQSWRVEDLVRSGSIFSTASRESRYLAEWERCQLMLLKISLGNESLTAGDGVCVSRLQYEVFQWLW
jgi:hypothetical protein